MPLSGILLVWLVEACNESIMLGVNQVLGWQTEHHTHYLILQKASYLDMAFYETPAYYNQMANAHQQKWRASNLPYQSMHFLKTLLTLGAISGLLFHLHPLVALIILLLSI